LVDVGDDELQRTAQCMARGCTWRVKSDAKHELMDAAYRHVALMKAAQS
jgi:predicted small metal-binding protein